MRLYTTLIKKQLDSLHIIHQYMVSYYLKAIVILYTSFSVREVEAENNPFLTQATFGD
jgi:hypothetical protein